MKTINVLIVLMLALALQACDSSPQQDKSERNKHVLTAQDNPLIGSWEVQVPEGVKQFKHFTSTHFSWHSASDDFSFTSGATGKYKFLSDNHYIETIELASGPIIPLVGTEAELKFTTTGDTIIASGELADGFKYSETWIRLK